MDVAKHRQREQGDEERRPPLTVTGDEDRERCRAGKPEQLDDDQRADWTCRQRESSRICPVRV
jgi:hypothetical protein